MDIPKLGLGTWQLVGNKCVDVVSNALKLGYRHIDTAEIYGNESEIGKAIKKAEEFRVVRREIFITSKVWRDNLHYEDVIKACNESLKRLRTTYLDLYLIHWPNKNIPIEETLNAFKELENQGKVKNFGVSNFTISHLNEALKKAKKIGIKLRVNQVEFHPYLYQKKLLEFCKKEGVIITAYSPLARGKALTDKVIKEIASKYNKTPPQVILRWLLNKGLIVIPKASSEKHLKENMDIEWRLAKEDEELIDRLNKNERIINPPFSEFD